jgi:hypothetical protein
MSKVNNLWTLANNIILLSVLCSTMALYAPIVKAILKAKKVSQDRLSRAASFRLFYSQNEAAGNRLNVCKSKSESNLKSTSTRETNGWRRSMKSRCQTTKNNGFLGVDNYETRRSASFSRIFYPNSEKVPMLDKPLLPNGHAILRSQDSEEDTEVAIRDDLATLHDHHRHHQQPTLSVEDVDETKHIQNDNNDAKNHIQIYDNDVTNHSQTYEKFQSHTEDICSVATNQVQRDELINVINASDENNEANLERVATFRLFYQEDSEPQTPNENRVLKNGLLKNGALQNGDHENGSEHLSLIRYAIPPTLTVENFDRPNKDESDLVRVASFRLFYPEDTSQTSSSSTMSNGLLNNEKNDESLSMLNFLNKPLDNLCRENQMGGDECETPFVRKSSFKKPVTENGTLKSKVGRQVSVLIPTNVSSSPSNKPVTLSSSPLSIPVTSSTSLNKPTTLAVSNLENQINSTTVWRKLNAIKVESCVSLHKKV